MQNMNDTIKLLALQAGGSHYPEVNSVQLKKFAELIIQECIGIVQNVPPGYKDYRDQIEDAFRADAIQEIKYHFGIE